MPVIDQGVELVWADTGGVVAARTAVRVAYRIALAVEDALLVVRVPDQIDPLRLAGAPLEQGDPRGADITLVGIGPERVVLGDIRTVTARRIVA